MTEGDFDRIEFCKTFLETVEKDVDVKEILCPLEAVFKLDGHVNHHNIVYWSDKTLSRHSIKDLIVTGGGGSVGEGIWSGVILGPVDAKS